MRCAFFSEIRSSLPYARSRDRVRMFHMKKYYVIQKKNPDVDDNAWMIQIYNSLLLEFV